VAVLTPCYALSAALLAATWHNADPALLESGVRAMHASVDEMAEYRTAHNHGEFFIQLSDAGLGSLRAVGAGEVRADSAEWKGASSRGLIPTASTRTTCSGKRPAYNHNVVALAGEYLRLKQD